jgi:hypothetical protein
MPASASTASKRACVLPGPITDEEPEPRYLFAEVRDEVAGLLRGPWSVRVLGHAQDVQVAVTDLEREQHVETPQRDRAVDVEEVDGEHAGGLGAQELPPAGVGMPDRCRWDVVALEDPPDRRGTDPVAEFEQLARDPLVSQFGLSVAIRTTSAANTSSIGGRPARFG